jgi:hypothetical protein
MNQTSSIRTINNALALLAHEADNDASDMLKLTNMLVASLIHKIAIPGKEVEICKKFGVCLTESMERVLDKLGAAPGEPKL